MKMVKFLRKKSSKTWMRKYPTSSSFSQSLHSTGNKTWVECCLDSPREWKSSSGVQRETLGQGGLEPSRTEGSPLLMLLLHGHQTHTFPPFPLSSLVPSYFLVFIFFSFHLCLPFFATCLVLTI